MNRMSFNLLFILGLFILSNPFFSQSKKKQIETMKDRVDSIYRVISTQRSAQNSKISALEVEASKFKNQNDSLNIIILNIDNQLINLEKEMEIKSSESSRLKKEVEKMKDSLRRISFNNNKETNSKTIKIGTQTWMTEDLSVSKYNNGDNIPEALNENQWNHYGKTKKGCFARLDNGAVLYNGYALHDPRGLVPVGFKIPSNNDFNILVNFLGAGDSETGSATLAMVTYPIFVENWVGDDETGGFEPVEIKTNGSSHFNAKRGGFIYDNGSNFLVDWDNCNYWWTSTSFEDNYYAFNIGYCSQDIGGNMAYPMAYGFSVRCMKNQELSQKTWEYDTLEKSSKKTICFSFGDNPYLVINSAPIEESTITIINLGLEKLNSKIPELLNGEETQSFIGDCKEEWLNQLCERPWRIYNEIDALNIGKYFSVLQMSQAEYCGATWASRGFSSYIFNLNTVKEIKIPDNVDNKLILKEEIKKHFERLKKSNPYFQYSQSEETIDYDKILNQIMTKSINHLTFYFNNDELSLAYFYYEDSWSNCKLFIPLPKLQKSLGM